MPYCTSTIQCDDCEDILDDNAFVYCQTCLDKWKDEAKSYRSLANRLEEQNKTLNKLVEVLNLKIANFRKERQDEV